jgi:hypothetical protein
MLHKADIICLLKEAAFDPDAYWVTSGAAMVLYGIRDAARDIDLGCTTPMADQLERSGCPAETLPDGSRKIVFSRRIELFENWIEDKVLFVEGFPVVSIEGIIKMKEKLGREKDLEDIRLIKEHLAKC